MSDLESGVKALSLVIATLAEGAAAIVVGVATVRAILWFGLSLLQGLLGRGTSSLDQVPKEEIRLSLGRSFALALEFEVGADILKTVVAPDWNSLLLLGGIIVLRTLLNYFLERELQAAEQRRPTASLPSPALR